MSLFRLWTDRLSLSWSAPRTSNPRTALGDEVPPGGVRVVYARPGAQVSVERAQDHEDGPYIYEQTDYRVLAKSLDGAPIRLVNRDPVLLRDIDRDDDDAIWHGIINYGSQIGVSRWELWHGQRLELAFELEVFPTKLSYRQDYDAILADVQGVLTALAIEYLRGTWQLGGAAPAGAAKPVEWLTSLRLHFDALERALEQVMRSPLRALKRRVEPVPTARVRATDKGLAAALRKAGAAERSVLHVWRAASDLDGPEHRWIAKRLFMMHRRLLALIQGLEGSIGGGAVSARKAKTLEELGQLAGRLGRWRARGPWAELDAQGGAGQTPETLALWRSPGYGELARLCHLMELGLWVGQHHQLPTHVKELSTLYEYWCYLTMARQLAQITGGELCLDGLFTLKEDGLSVRLGAGQQSVVEVRLKDGAQLRLMYNPTLSQFSLHPQRPDMLLSVERQGWPALHLIMDAKYRIDPHGEVGPPVDAINVLHRYRDAILQPAWRDEREDALEHGVVQAVALFPYREPAGSRGSYAQNRLWRSLERYGVGALPLLPGELEYAQRWLEAALGQTGWLLAERAIGHAGSSALSIAASQSRELAMVGVLSGKAPQRHLDWCLSQRSYYVPLKASSPRQQALKWIALYVPSAVTSPGAVRYMAQVERVELVARGQLQTPWGSGKDPEAMCVLYRTGPWIALEQPVLNTSFGEMFKPQRFSAARWTSRYALARAQHVGQLVLELEQEWQLYEALALRGLDFKLRAAPLERGVQDWSAGHARFVCGDLEVRWDGGAGGFRVERAGEGAVIAAAVAEVVGILGDGGKSAWRIGGDGL